MAVGKYNKKFYYAQDYKLFSDMISQNFKYKVINEPLYYLNMIDNLSSKYKSDQQYFANCVRKLDSLTMKVYVNSAKKIGLWSRYRKEWIKYNKDSFSFAPNRGIIWLMSPWTWKKIQKILVRRKFYAQSTILMKMVRW